jgi:DNA-binding transcriptional LysR family regulator
MGRTRTWRRVWSYASRAAEREHIVQSALSQQVQRLERELGVGLLERSTHHISRTAAGAVFRRH